MVAKPSRPDNVVPVSEVLGTRIDQAFLGSCTNGRISDLRIGARMLRDHPVHPDVRLIVTPASQEVYLQALDEGLIRQFITAGALVTNPTCGACIGGHMGLLADGEVCIASSNRNFVGRMGSRKGEIYLASPAVVVASAIAGCIRDPRDYLHRVNRWWRSCKQNMGIRRKCRTDNIFPTDSGGDRVLRR
jgi:3-isopropylmalate/(R)-2-methylmalate dehydratase large subunit